jgi:predicted dehydrogenase
VGVLGCGAIACQYHLPALRELSGVELAAMADPRAEARTGATALTGVAASADPDDVLVRDDLDAVVICADNAAHAELAEAAAEAGKHLYLEKPIALTVDDAHRVVAAVERSGVTAAIGFNFRFHPLHLRTRDLLRAGTIGKVRAVRTRYDQPQPPESMRWRRHRSAGGGALLDLGSHHIDLAGWFLDEEIDQVLDCELESRLSEDDTARVRARLSSGATFDGDFSYRRGYSSSWAFIGERGQLVVDRYARSIRLRPTGPPPERRWRNTLRRKIYRLPILRRERVFALSLGAFVERLRGSPREVPTPAEGLRNLEVVLQAEAAMGAR